MGKLALFSVALMSFGAAVALASPIERIEQQARSLASGGTGNYGAVMDGGKRPFRIQPNNGYVGLETRIDIHSYYESFEFGGHNIRMINHAVIDWGDGSSPVRAEAGESAYHTYGHRDPGGSISPNRNIVYEGKITFVTSSGDAFTEGFRYSMWNNRLGSTTTGGRHLHNDLIDSVNGAGSRDKLPGGFYNRNSQ